MRPKQLSPEEIQKALASCPDWSRVEEKIHREFRFQDFEKAFAFMTQCAKVAESLNHHPEWFNVYNRVEVQLTTHDAGGLTSLDFELARCMDEIAQNH